MIRIAHISDLHFGRADEALREPLLQAIEAARPDLVAVSGDLTQRARRGEFAQARAFLDDLPAQWLCVPGNHDIPLDRPFLRVLRPFARYKRAVGDTLAPRCDLPGLVVQGLNTADPFAWQRGRIRRRELREACAAFAGTHAVRIVVAHHPFKHSPETHKTLMKGAERALDALVDCGADIILTGHLHRWRTEPFLSRRGGGRLLQLHIGTGLSTRLRGEDNDFALLDFEGRRCEVTRMIARHGTFVPAEKTQFDLADRKPD